MKAGSSFAKRLSVDVGVGLAIILAAALLFGLSLIIGRIPPFNWLLLFCLTPVLFWVVLKQHRKHWRMPALWLATVGMLAAHVMVFVMVLRAYPRFPGIWFLPIGAIEVWPIDLTLRKLVANRSRR